MEPRRIVPRTARNQRESDSPRHHWERHDERYPWESRAEATLLTRIPEGRIGRPEDVALIGVFQASDEADYRIDLTFLVDGSWLAG